MSTLKRLLRNWIQGHKATNGKKKPTVRRFRPYLEALEERDLLAVNPVFIDGTTVTDGNGTAVTAPPTVTNLTPVGFTFTTQGDVDVITIDSPSPGKNRISGTSGGVAFASITFSNVANVSIDTGANDKPGSNSDSIQLTSALIATGLTNLTMQTGAGDDSVNFGALGLANSVAVTLTMGAGTNRLTGPTAGSIWAITSANTGSLHSGSGAANVQFTAVRNLTAGNISDILDYSGYASAVTVDLAGGTATGFSTISGFRNVVGSPFNDTITGDANDNLLSGGGGTDMLNGAGGSDTVAESGSGTFNLQNASLTIGTAVSDALTSIEKAQLTGGDSGNIFNAGAFSLGSVRLISGAGADTYQFNASQTGTFLLDEKTAGGTDTLDFSGNTTGIALDLSKIDEQTVTGNLKLTLSAANVFENVIGGSGADNITGNALDNVISGNGGNDTVAGGAGNDTVMGPAGDTTWLITGANTGEGDSVNTPTTVLRFSSVENLTGATNNSDTFVVRIQGSMSGLVDGGTSGHDRISFDRTVTADGLTVLQKFTYRVTGPQSGVITRDGTALVYAGMEPTNDTGIILPVDLTKPITDQATFPGHVDGEGNLLTPLNNLIDSGIDSLNQAAYTFVVGLNTVVDGLNVAAKDVVDALNVVVDGLNDGIDALNSLDVADIVPDIPHIPAIPYIPNIPYVPSIPTIERIDPLVQGLGWTYVDHQNHYRDVQGVITQFETEEFGTAASQVTNTDFPSTHTSHDLNTFVYVDPGYENLVSVGNEGPGILYSDLVLEQELPESHDKGVFQVSSATRHFVAADVGKNLAITSGAGFPMGVFDITSVTASGAAIVTGEEEDEGHSVVVGSTGGKGQLVPGSDTLGPVTLDPNGNKRIMEVEWEAGITPGPGKPDLDMNPNVKFILDALRPLGINIPDLIKPFGSTDKTGDGTAGNGIPIYPKWAHPSVGDRVWFNGSWIYDVGHPHVVGNQPPRYNSEIHPARAAAVMRNQFATDMPGFTGFPLSVIATDIYIHGAAGLAATVENAIEANRSGGASANADAVLGVLLDAQNHPVEANPIDENFSFDIKLPPKPAGATFDDLVIKLVMGPGNNETTSVDPTYARDDYDPVTNTLHVHINLQGTGVDPNAVYARQLKVGWKTPDPDFQPVHVKLGLDSIDVFKKDGDNTVLEFKTVSQLLDGLGIAGLSSGVRAIVGDTVMNTSVPTFRTTTATNPGEFTFSWFNVNSGGALSPSGQATGNEWIRLSDYAGGDVMNNIIGGSAAHPGAQNIPIGASFDFYAGGNVKVALTADGKLMFTSHGGVLQQGRDLQDLGGNGFVPLLGTPATNTLAAALLGIPTTATLSGTIVLPAHIDIKPRKDALNQAGNDTLNLEWNSIEFTITLPQGTYTPAELVAKLQEQLDAHLPVIRLQANGFDQNGLDNLQDFRPQGDLLRLGLGFVAALLGNGDNKRYKHLITTLSPNDLKSLKNGSLTLHPANPEWVDSGGTKADPFEDFGGGFRLNLGVISADAGDPILATNIGNGVLRLNMGPNAADRKQGDTVDGFEQFTVRHLSTQPDGSETVAVTSFGTTQIYIGVKKIIGNGGRFSDTLTIDGQFTIPIEYGGGGDAGDKMVLQDATFATITHQFINDHDGSIALDPGPGGAPRALITYTGLAPITDNMSASNRVFTFTGGAQIITLSGLDAGLSRIDSTLGEAVDFVNPTATLTVNGGDGADTISVSQMNFPGTLTINGGGGADSLHVSDLTLGTLAIDGGAGSDQLFFDSGHIELTGNLTAQAEQITIAARVHTSSAATEPILLQAVNGINWNNLVSADGTATIHAVVTSGPIVVGGADTVKVRAQHAVLEAANGIGSFTVALRTDVARLTAVTHGGDSNISNVGALIVEFVGVAPSFPNAGRTLLSAAGGSITAADASSLVRGGSVFLAAPGGALGSASLPLGVDVGTGGLQALAGLDIFLRQTAGRLPVVLVQSTGGSIQLTVPDSVASGEDLQLIKTVADGGAIIAQQNVTLQVGDNVTIPSGTLIRAGGAVIIRGDFSADGIDHDPGVGTIIEIAGRIEATSLYVFGGADADTFNITVGSGQNLPATTTIDGGSSNNDSLKANWAQDFNGALNLLGLEKAAITVGRDFNGAMSDTLPGTIQQLSIGHALTSTGQLTAGSIDSMTIGPDTRTAGDDMAGRIVVLGTLGDLRVAGGTPGTIVAGHVGTVRVYGGYGPVVLQINEAGIQRRVEAAVPGMDYPIPTVPPAPALPTSPAGVTFQYYYESGTLANPQLTARVSNSSPRVDQFDLSLVTYNDAAKFNLARLDAAGVSGIRNVAIEGDLLTAVTSGASGFFKLPAATAAGVRLGLDVLAGVAVRDYAPNGYIQAKSIQAVAFGSHTRGDGKLETGAVAPAPEAARLLTAGTAIVMASDTFRVPFADLPAFQVGFFFATDPRGGKFDSQNIALFVQARTVANATLTANIVTPQNVARGAATALIKTVPTFDKNGKVQNSVVQTIDFRGDGVSMVSGQYIAGGITSTGPLGDLTFKTGPINNVTAPSIFGSIGNGPIVGTVQTTGLRTDPITGVITSVPADLGRIFVTMTDKGPIAVSTTVTSKGPGLSGRLIARGNLISQVLVDGGLSGLVAVQGNIATTMAKDKDGRTVRLGGLVVNGGMSGQVVVLGTAYADVIVHGGLKGGRIAVKGDIVGNLTIDGSLDLTSAVVAGGKIGDTAAGTALKVGDVKGILGAEGNIVFDRPPNTKQAAFFGSNLKTNDAISAAAIDSIFMNNGTPLDFDLDLTGLGLICKKLAALHVSKGKLA